MARDLQSQGMAVTISTMTEASCLQACLARSDCAEVDFIKMNVNDIRCLLYTETMACGNMIAMSTAVHYQRYQCGKLFYSESQNLLSRLAARYTFFDMYM